MIRAFGSHALAVIISAAAVFAAQGGELRFPADQFGQANLALSQSTANLDLETTFQNRSDNFELIGKFSEDHRFRTLAKPVGRLDLLVADVREGEQWIDVCTAWLISKEYLITSFHCFKDDFGRRHDVKEAIFRVGYLSERKNEGESYIVDPTPIEWDSDLDYAILKVDGEPGETHGVVQIGTRDPKLNQELFIIHHPLGKPQRLTRRFCRVIAEDALHGQDFRHLCDTLPGSSGAPVFSDVGNVAIGIHYLGGLDETSPESFNSAKRLSVIAMKSRIVADIIRPSSQEPGLYSTAAGGSAQRVTAGMLRAVPGDAGRKPDDGARPYGFSRDVRGACFVRNLPAGNRLSWDDIGLCE